MGNEVLIGSIIYVCQDWQISLRTASIVHLPAWCNAVVECCLQGKHAAEAFRVRMLRATKHAPDEYVRWISAARSQPSHQAQQLLQGGRELLCS